MRHINPKSSDGRASRNRIDGGQTVLGRVRNRKGAGATLRHELEKVKRTEAGSGGLGSMAKDEAVSYSTESAFHALGLPGADDLVLRAELMQKIAEVIGTRGPGEGIDAHGSAARLRAADGQDRQVLDRSASAGVERSRSGCRAADHPGPGSKRSAACGSVGANAITAADKSARRFRGTAPPCRRRRRLLRVA